MSSVVYSQNKSNFQGGKYYSFRHTQLSPAELYKIPRYDLTYTKQSTKYGRKGDM